VRIVLATFGSLGDLHPFLALAIGLRERVYQPVIATQPIVPFAYDQANNSMRVAAASRAILAGKRIELKPA
jgi:hypothetical protein